MVRVNKGKQGKIRRLKKRNKVLILVVSLILVTTVIFSSLVIGFKTNLIQGASVSLIGPKEEVSLLELELENEVYPQFICACCGGTIDSCSCGMAGGMKEEINLLAGEGLSKDEILLEATKKFGLNSLADETLQEKIREEMIKDAPKDRPKIGIEPEIYNFGDISQARGIVSGVFSVRNLGNKDLIINNMVTSCMCTTASLIVGDKEGPRFGMHDNPKWTATLKPGETAQLKVYYDPNIHKDLGGYVARTVEIFSNDPIDFQKQVKIELNQVP